MQTIILTEPKKRYIANLIIFLLLLIGALITVVKCTTPTLSIIFTVLLIIPSIGIVSYLWDVPSKIELSEDEMVIYYGRSISEKKVFEGSFTFPSTAKFKWEDIAGFDRKSYTYQTWGGGDSGTTTTTYDYLIVTGSSPDNLNPSGCTILLNRFENTPEEILAICKQFQKERTCSC
jgi:hypothetical protein